MVENSTEDSGSTSSETDESSFVVGVYPSQLDEREVSVWYNSDFAWTIGDRTLNDWYLWSKEWFEEHEALVIGLFSTRVFQPKVDKIGQWILCPAVCQECDRFVPAPRYWYSVCPSCWAVGSNQVWNWLVNTLGGPPAEIVWRFAVINPKDLDFIRPMEATLYSYGSELHPEFVAVIGSGMLELVRGTHGARLLTNFFASEMRELIAMGRCT
jgi:hypothetical protein